MYEVFIKRVPHGVFMPANIVSKNFLGVPATRYGGYHIPLSLAEQKALLPDFIMLDYKDPEYKKSVDKLFKDTLTLQVPHEEGIAGTGAKLNITIRSGNKEANPYGPNKRPVSLVDEKGELRYEPDNLIDYLRWRVALDNPVVANSPEEITRTTGKKPMFYIEEISYQKKRRVSQRKKEEEAFEKYIKIKNMKDEKIAEFFTMITSRKPKDVDDMLDELHTILKNSPEKYSDIEVDEDYSISSIARLAIKSKVITRKGKWYFYESENLGSSEDAVIESLGKPEFSGTLVEIKAAIE